MDTSTKSNPLNMGCLLTKCHLFEIDQGPQKRVEKHVMTTHIFFLHFDLWSTSAKTSDQASLTNQISGAGPAHSLLLRPFVLGRM